jgi:hypothetical protein
MVVTAHMNDKRQLAGGAHKQIIGLPSLFDPVQIHFDRPLHQTGACRQTMTSIPYFLSP